MCKFQRVFPKFSELFSCQSSLVISQLPNMLHIFLFHYWAALQRGDLKSKLSLHTVKGMHRTKRWSVSQKLARQVHISRQLAMNLQTDVLLECVSWFTSLKWEQQSQTENGVKRVGLEDCLNLNLGRITEEQYCTHQKQRKHENCSSRLNQKPSIYLTFNTGHQQLSIKCKKYFFFFLYQSDLLLLLLCSKVKIMDRWWLK